MDTKPDADDLFDGLIFVTVTLERLEPYSTELPAMVREEALDALRYVQDSLALLRGLEGQLFKRIRDDP
jgi:hypothetical protein